MSPSDEARWFEDQVQMHETALRAYLARRFSSLSDHDDLIQEIYSRVFRAWKLGRVTHVRGFLFTAARNVAIDQIRRRHGQDALIEDEKAVLLDESLGVQEQIDRTQRMAILAEAIDSLPTRCREVMLLRYLEGFSYKEIARRLGLSPETVKVHLVKGVRNCTRHFHQRGILDERKVIPLAS